MSCGKKPCKTCNVPTKQCQMIDGNCSGCANKLKGNGNYKPQSRAQYTNLRRI